jgi:CheY-like chemotaxis protein
MTRIVIIEEEEHVLYALQRGLRRDGVEIIAAQNSQEALSAISGGKPDMVLLDVLLPDLERSEVCRHLSITGKTLLPFLLVPLTLNAEKACKHARVMIIAPRQDQTQTPFPWMLSMKILFCSIHAISQHTR